MMLEIPRILGATAVVLDIVFGAGGSEVGADSTLCGNFAAGCDTIGGANSLLATISNTSVFSSCKRKNNHTTDSSRYFIISGA